MSNTEELERERVWLEFVTTKSEDELRAVLNACRDPRLGAMIIDELNKRREKGKI